MGRPDWIDRRDWYDPTFQWHMWRARVRDRRSIERPCSEGNCTEFVDSKTGEMYAGWGPVGCPCDA